MQVLGGAGGGGEALSNLQLSHVLQPAAGGKGIKRQGAVLYYGRWWQRAWTKRQLVQPRHVLQIVKC